MKAGKVEVWNRTVSVTYGINSGDATAICYTDGCGWHRTAKAHDAKHVEASAIAHVCLITPAKAREIAERKITSRVAAFNKIKVAA